MTSTPSEPRLYDVWLMWVEFPDHPGIGKPRPVVITEVDGDLVSGIVAKITGNTDWDEAGDVPLLDWKAEGLLKPSLVRCGRGAYQSPQDVPPPIPREWNKGRGSQPSVCSVLTTGQGQTAMLVIAVIDGLMDLFYEAILIETII